MADSHSSPFLQPPRLQFAQKLLDGDGGSVLVLSIAFAVSIGCGGGVVGVVNARKADYRLPAPLSDLCLNGKDEMVEAVEGNVEVLEKLFLLLLVFASSVASLRRVCGR
ncbi:hypothetical protein LTR86_008666 [Recurvomyces mirabilis]|nr:hypothetical protein LTR86_008666 [Recurvomyces mirabilis]